MADHFAERVKLPSPRTILRGVRWFLLFSAMGVAVAFWWKTPADIGYLTQHIDGLSLTLVIPLVFLDFVLGGARYRLFFNGKILPRISTWNCMRSNWANIFLGAVTPFQTGGGPAQVYVLWRCGAKVSEAVMVSLINFAATLVFFLVSSSLVLMWIPPDLFDSSLMPLLRTGFLVIAALAVMVLLFLAFPSSCLIPIRKILCLLPRRFVKLHAAVSHWLSVFEAETVHCRDLFRSMGRERARAFLMVPIATAILFLNKYFMGYVIARAFGQEVHFGGFIGLLTLQYFLIYFAPTPGASGVAEMSSTWLLGKMLSVNVLLYYTIAWRLVTVTLGAFIGCFVILQDLRKRVNIH